MQQESQTDMNATPSGSRTRISFFGLRNAGKSTLVNAVTGQQVAIVSDVAGTTTDPVSKAMEILPLGPCLVTDTAGLDDEGELGVMRVEKSLAVLAATDIAVWVDEHPAGEAAGEPSAHEARFRAECAKRGIPVLTYRRGDSVEALKAKLAAMAPNEPPPLVADLVSPGDFVVCVCPIDGSAPKGRLILPQQQVIRELLDCGCTAVVCQPSELAATLRALQKPRFVVTDSQAFEAVDAIVPHDIPLTSFSILFARQKGDLAKYCEGAKAMKSLKDGDTVLISEGCTHHRQCNDIGTVKLPRWLGKFTGKKLKFEFSSGNDFPLMSERREEPLPDLVIHCGGCMLTRRAVLARISAAEAAGVPIVNYGVAIALMHGIVAHPGTCMVERG